jgi:hypothetical protein
MDVHTDRLGVDIEMIPNRSGSRVQHRMVALLTEVGRDPLDRSPAPCPTMRADVGRAEATRADAVDPLDPNGRRRADGNAAHQSGSGEPRVGPATEIKDTDGRGGNREERTRSIRTWTVARAHRCILTGRYDDDVLPPMSRPATSFTRRAVGLTLGILSASTALGGFGAVPVASAASSGSEAAAAKAAYIEEADKVCTTGKNQMRAALEKFEDRVGYAGSQGRAKKVKIGSSDTIGNYVTAVLPMIEDQVNKLALLKAPTSDRQLISTLLRDTRTALTVAKKDPKQVAYDDPFHDLGKRYRSYGFKECGTDARPWNKTDEK